MQFWCLRVGANLRVSVKVRVRARGRAWVGCIRIVVMVMDQMDHRIAYTPPLHIGRAWVGRMRIVCIP